MLSPDLEKQLTLFKGDLTSLAVYAFLCSISKDPSAKNNLSMRKIMLFAGMGRSRLIKILSKLKSFGLIEFNADKFGTEVCIKGAVLLIFKARVNPNGTRVLSNEHTLVLTGTVAHDPYSGKKPQVPDTKGEHTLSFTGSEKFIEYGESAPYIRSHSTSSNVQQFINSPSYLPLSKRKAGTGQGKGKRVLATHTLSVPDTRPLVSGSLSKIPKTAKPKKEKPPLQFTPEDLELAKLWLVYAKREMSWTIPPASWTEENFASALAKVKRATEIHNLKDVLSFIEHDDFWCKNALSPASLLTKSKNGLRKIDNILSRMKPKSLKKEEKLRGWTDDEIAELF